MLHPLPQLLFGEYRRRILDLLLLNPERSLHVREIARLTDTSPGTLHKELAKLAEAGILARHANGNQVEYRADLSCPIYEELAAILRKTSGFAETIKDALRPIQASISVAFIFGSMASGKNHAFSDIDVMLIGDVLFADAVRCLYNAQQTLKREINPKIYSLSEWQSAIAADEPFLREVLARPKLFLIGNSDDLGNQGHRIALAP